MPGYWNQTTLRLSVKCWNRLKMFSAATESAVTETATKACGWAVGQYEVDRWHEVTDKVPTSITPEVHTTSFRIQPDLKEKIRSCSRAEGIDMVDFIEAAVWGYTFGVDVVAENGFLTSAMDVESMRRTERRDNSAEQNLPSVELVDS